jgi:hypothetical protein
LGYHDRSQITMTAAELRSHLEELKAERSLAVISGLAEVESYMDDLSEELEACRELYVGSAVTEIATLRAELSGPQMG